MSLANPPWHRIYPRTLAPLPSDQENSRPILHAHVARRILPASSLLGLCVHAARKGLRGSSVGAGRGLAAGLVASGVLTEGYMYTKPDPESEGKWQDRAWRLQRNVDQTDLDNFVQDGMLAGGVLAGGDAWRMGGLGKMWGVVPLRAAGLVGMGSLVGMGTWATIRVVLGKELEVPDRDL